MDVTNMKHGYIQLAETVVEGVSDAQLPGKFWVHFLPIFKYIPSWVPGAYFKKFVERHNPVVQKMLGQPFEAVKKDIVRSFLLLSSLVFNSRPTGRRESGEFSCSRLD